MQRVEYKWLVAVAFVCGLFMDLMDATILNVALPQLGREFQAGTATLEWVVTGYLLSLAVWIPASGWVGDRFGTKRTFLFALAVFTSGSALCGMAANVEQLIAFRVLQGVGGGMMVPVGAAMLFRAFPPAERARASTILMIPTVTAPALGPVLGGWLVSAISWRAIFFVNVPIGAAAFVFALLALREHREERAGRLDVIGFVASGAGLALVLYALSRGPEEGWAAPSVLATGLLGVLLFGILAVVELRHSEPLLDLRLYTNRLFRNSNFTFYTATGSLFSGIFLLTLELQQLRGLTPLQAGLTGFPMSVGTLLVIPIVGRLYPRIGPRRLIAFGMLGIAVTSVLFIGVDLTTNLGWISALLFVRGLAFGFCIIPVQAATYATIAPQSMGRATSLFSTGRQVGTSLSIALLVTVLTERANSHVQAAAHTAQVLDQVALNHAQLLGFHDAFAASAAIAVLGLVFAALIRDEDARATMRQPAVAPVPDSDGAAVAHAA